MAEVNCGLKGCKSIIKLDGTGHSYWRKVDEHKVFYCSADHQQKDAVASIKPGARERTSDSL